MKTIIFDMDGTILDTIVDITNAVNYILEKNGMPKRSVDEVKFFVGNGLYKTLERSVPEGTNEEVVKGIYEFKGLLDKLYNKDWIVYTKQAFNGAKSVINYLWIFNSLLPS